MKQAECWQTLNSMSKDEYINFAPIAKVISNKNIKVGKFAKKSLIEQKNLIEPWKSISKTC